MLEAIADMLYRSEGVSCSSVNCFQTNPLGHDCRPSSDSCEEPGLPNPVLSSRFNSVKQNDCGRFWNSGILDKDVFTE